MYSDKALTLMQFSDGTLQDAMNCFHKVTPCVSVLLLFNLMEKRFSEWAFTSLANTWPDCALLLLI